jgi:ketosteroid isomerase-like protein
MSQENVEAVLRGYEAFNRGDLDAAAEGFHPEIEWSGPGVLPEKREIYRGIDGVRRFWGQWQAEFEDFTVEIEEVIEAGEQVIVMAAVSGTGRGSGAHVRSPTFPHVWTIRDGQAVRMEMLRTRAEALEATGLRE